MALIAVVILAAEVVECQNRFQGRLCVSSWVEVLIYALVFPIMIGLLLNLEYSRTQLSDQVSRFNLQRVIQSQLMQARDGDELMMTVLQIPRMLLPVVGDSLSVLDPDKDRYEVVAAWRQDQVQFSQLQDGQSAPIRQHPVPESWLQNAVCLPLSMGGKPVALLHLFFPPDITANADRLQILVDMAPEMAIAIERMNISHSEIGLIDASQAERKRIARHLHDTLAHDIAYLRLKLDQWTGHAPSQELEHLQGDLVRMRNVAEQSYEQVRKLLVELQEESSPDFVSALHQFVDVIGDRANFSVQITNRGQPKALAPEVGRQILYITRETLRNIEKHANASNVAISLAWESNGLKMDIQDDGKGFDVDSSTQISHHYGLRIIRDLAHELNGKLSLHSAADQGTQIELWFPLDFIQEI